MYTVDGDDAVQVLPGVPQSSLGAPLPMVLASEHALLLAYLAELPDDDWDGTTVRVVTAESPGEAVVLVEFVHPYAHYLGAPGDEAFDGHPLSGRGLAPNRAFMVRESSWVRALERMDSAHPYHRAERFARMQHFVFAFHDSTFECVADGLRWTQHPGPLAAVIPEMQRRTLRSLA